MSSNVNSAGIPVDHDGAPLEDDASTGYAAPFAIRGDVFQEIFSGSNRDTSALHLDANPLGDSWVIPNAAKGGAPVIERVEIEDLGEGYESDEPLSPNSAAALCKNETSASIHAMLRNTKHEREALFAARRKLADALAFLKAQGFKEEQIFEAQVKDGFGSRPPARDEFGLPIRSGVVGSKPANPFVDKMKEKVGSPVKNEVGSDTHQVLDEMTGKPPVQTNVPVGESTGSEKPKSWAELVNNKATVQPVSFDYFPMKSGSKVVSPLKDILIKGNEKLKYSLVGLFSKGYLSFKKVSEFAFTNWRKFGLLTVSQKNERTFVFRFAETGGMHSVLATGTWYIEKRPLLVHSWGSPPGSITNMPLWVRFDNVPDSYWTREGLSYLGSAIGKPLSADALTNKLEILPFAKLCVEYNIGDDLPTKLDVEILDPVNDALYIREVLVSYPNKPIVSTGCKTLGHLVGACPKVLRKWVEKKRTLDATATEEPVKANSPTAQPPVPPSGTDKGCEHTVLEPNSTSGEEWQTVSKKSRVRPAVESPTTASPPLNTFKNLTSVDEVEAKLTRSQRKKLRRTSKAVGNSSASPSH